MSRPALHHRDRVQIFRWPARDHGDAPGPGDVLERCRRGHPHERTGQKFLILTARLAGQRSREPGWDVWRYTVGPIEGHDPDVRVEGMVAGDCPEPECVAWRASIVERAA